MPNTMFISFPHATWECSYGVLNSKGYTFGN